MIVMMPSSTFLSLYSEMSGSLAATGEGNNSNRNFDVSSLGKDDFLTLLLAQLRHQDPLNPADNTAFIAQLAQFSSLEQMTRMNGNLEKTLENNTAMSAAISNAMMINYFGKNVTAETNAFMFDGENPVELWFALESATGSGTLEIRDSYDNVVRTIELGAMDAGLNSYEWDGMKGIGTLAGAGEFTYRLELTAITGGEVSPVQLISGRVDGISWKDGVTQLSIGGLLVPYEKVIGIAESE